MIAKFCCQYLPKYAKAVAKIVRTSVNMLIDTGALDEEMFAGVNHANQQEALALMVLSRSLQYLVSLAPIKYDFKEE
jgi:hypothetical protein